MRRAEVCSRRRMEVSGACFTSSQCEHSESQSLQTACTEMRPPGAGGPRETKEASAAVLAGRCAVTAAQSSS